MYSYPFAFAALAICSSSSAPSLQVLCIWRSPLRSPASIKARKPSLSRSLYLPCRLPQLWRDELEPELPVDFRLALPGDPSPVFVSKSPYSFSFQPFSIARLRRMMLCSFEPVK